MNSFRYPIWLCLYIATAVLSACEFGERGGVTLKPKDDSFNGYIPPGEEPKLESIAILSHSAKCLQLAPQDYAQLNNPARIEAWNCKAEIPFQSWHVTEDQEIMSTNGQCLSLGARADDGFNITAVTCSGSRDQKWDINEQTGTINNNQEYHLCLGIQFVNLEQNGDLIQLLSCHGKESQQWKLVPLKRQTISSAQNTALKINIEPKPEGPPLGATPIINGWLSAEWSLEPAGSHYRIRNYWKPDQFLHIEYGNLQSGPAHHYWLSGQWTLIRQSDGPDAVYLFRSAWKTDVYIGLDENQNLRAGNFSELVDGSTEWRIQDVNP